MTTGVNVDVVLNCFFFVEHKSTHIMSMICGDASAGHWAERADRKNLFKREKNLPVVTLSRREQTVTNIAQGVRNHLTWETPPPGVQRPHHKKQAAQKLTPRPRVTPRLLTGLTGRRRVGESSRGGTGSSSSRRSHEAAARKTPTGMWPERPIQPHEGPTCWSRCEGVASYRLHASLAGSFLDNSLFSCKDRALERDRPYQEKKIHASLAGGQ